MIKSIVIFSAAALMVGGCVSGPTQPEFKASKVIERMPGHDETPKFATKSSVTEEGGDVIYSHIMTFSGNTRVEVCTGAASENAKTLILRYIEEAITTSGQLNETGGSGDDPAVESLSAYLAQNKIHGVKTVDEYWEKFETSDEVGARVLKLRCAAKVAINKALLAKQLRQAIDGAPQGNPEIRQRLINAQKDFIENVGKEKSGAAVAPAKEAKDKATEASE